MDFVPGLPDIGEIPDMHGVTGTVLPANIQSSPMICYVRVAIPHYGESQDTVLNTLKLLYHTMTERLVEIPITKQTRDELKKIKGILTYEQFLREILRGH
jgi:hypothetical protein